MIQGAVACKSLKHSQELGANRVFRMRNPEPCALPHRQFQIGGMLFYELAISGLTPLQGLLYGYVIN